MTAPLISERVRCAGCAAETSQATLDAAPTTMGWVEHEGFRLCADCAPAAKYIVALDRERNAHQVTIGRLEQLRERTITEERVREVVRAAINHEEVLAGHPAIVTIADLAAKELAGAAVGQEELSRLRRIESAARSHVARWRTDEIDSTMDELVRSFDAAAPSSSGPLTEDDLRSAVREACEWAHQQSLAQSFEDHIADRVAEHLAGRTLATAFDREVKPATASIGPTDTVLLVEALDLWDRYLTAPHADIKRIRAALTGPVPS